MIQISGLRKGDAFFEKGWRAKDIFDLFQNMEEHIKQVPEEDRWNIFYTVANCTDEKRKFLHQQVIPLDIDGIARGTEDQIVNAICEELQLPKDKLGIVYSGNGVHILIGVAQPFDSVYLRTNKPYYKALCGRVNQALFNSGLAGTADTVVFSEARLLRMPFTKNVKKDKEDTHCTLVSGNLSPLDIDLFVLSDLPSVGEGEHVNLNTLLRLPDPDTEAVLDGCGFIKHCIESEEPITEPQWYAMLSVVARLENGIELAHNASRPIGRKHSTLTKEATAQKIKHSIEAAGPRTCSNISQMYEGCKTCPHFGKITSPILITGPNTIRSQSNGFYNIVMDKNGELKTGRPNYDDLVKYFNKIHEYVTIQSSQQVLAWKGTHWVEVPRSLIHNFAETNFNPTPSNTMCLEFESKLRRSNLRDDNFTIVEGFLNFKNGVLNLQKGIMEPHDSKYGFTYTIPYDYAPTGSHKVFDKFIDDVTCGDTELADLITEYMGYCLSGTDPAMVQKCAILYGDGANGKSVVLSLLRELVGRENSSAVSITHMKKEQYRSGMVNKLFNASDESPTDAFLDSSTFKAMVSGDIVGVRKLYQDLIEWKCTTKLIFNCNELPYMTDFSYGMARRLVIIPFKATFSYASGNLDPDILKKILVEKSDIFKYCLDKFAAVAKRDYKFTEPKAVEEEADDYKYLNDHIERFIYTMCEVNTSHRQVIVVDEVYNLFALWCKDNNIKPMVYGSFVRRFGKKITVRYPRLEKARPVNDGGGRATGYKHLIIKAVSPSQINANF